MPIDLQITMTGLLAYVIEDEHIDVLILASREHSHPHPEHPPQEHGGGHGHGAIDVHTPALMVPLGKLTEGTSAADMVIDTGTEEYGVWLLKETFVEAQIDGKPQGQVCFGLDRGPQNERGGGTCERPTPCDEDDMSWLASIGRAAAMPVQFRNDVLPPYPDLALVSGAIRITDGAVKAYWTGAKAKRELFDFVLPKEIIPEQEMPRYCTALAEGARWSVTADAKIEILLRPLKGGPPRTLVMSEEFAHLEIAGAISNKPTTVGGKPPHGSSTSEISHFLLYYDLVDPAPPAWRRRIPVLEKAAVGGTPPAVRDSRCPGSSA